MPWPAVPVHLGAFPRRQSSPNGADASKLGIVQALLLSPHHAHGLATLDLLRKSGEFFVMKEDLDDQTEAANEGI